MMQAAGLGDDDEELMAGSDASEKEGNAEEEEEDEDSSAAEEDAKAEQGGLRVCACLYDSCHLSVCAILCASQN